MGPAELLKLFRSIANDDLSGVSEMLRKIPALATTATPVGASRQQSTDFFLTKIAHYVYAGDTALHVAAAAFSRPIAELLVTFGADVRVRNRRGAEPLHYAADGRSSEQPKVIEFLISHGADPNVVDKSGVAPLHRAVRRRSPEAVRALLDGGANVWQRNGSGSTPLHLAVQNTGASGSGSDEAHLNQAAIIELLLEHGARPDDKDAKGKDVWHAAASEWIRKLLMSISST